MIETKKLLPNHLISVPGTEWAFWRTAVLRGAGFPVSLILDFDTKACASSVNQVIALEQEVILVRQDALDIINHHPEGWSDPKKRKTMLEAITVLQKGNVPDDTQDNLIDEALHRLQVVLQNLENARYVYNQLFDETEEQITKKIFKAASHQAFSEAIVWQNPLLFETGLRKVQTGNDKALSEIQPGHLRQRKRLVANYLQRYCLKNDTIGFFGPVGWAQLTSTCDTMNLQLGPSLLGSRSAYFESWGIDLLAESLATDDVLPWLCPRRMPYVYIGGQYNSFTPYAPFKIPVSHAVVLRTCDGKQTAKALAAKLIRDPFSGLKSEDEVYAVLHELRRNKRIAWTLEIPFGTSPEQKLRKMILQNENEAFRQKAVKTLDELEDARSKIVNAAGDSEALMQAIISLNETFTRLTGQSANRKAGEMYAARTLVYEDCRRDINLEVGEKVLTTLSTPLSLILMSARWLAVEMGKTFEKTSEDIYTNLVERFGSSQVDLINFWFISPDALFNKETSPLLNLITDLQTRWKDILHIPYEQSRVQYASADLLQQVEETFKAPIPEWVSAHYHSPDIMIAATSLEAIQQNEYLLILGEIHVCSNAIATELFLSQHPNLDEIIGALEADYSTRRVAAAMPRDWRPLRTRPMLVCPNGYRIVFGHDTWESSDPSQLPVGELVVEKIDGKLWICSRDGLLKFSLLEVFEDALSAWVVHEFSFIPTENHVPRLTIDRLVINRETWRFSPDDIPSASKNDAERFLSFQRWVRTNALPRFAFYRTPLEQKPIFIDFENPIYVDIFAKQVRKVIESGHKDDMVITLTEMLPSPEDAWLPDQDGNHYTSEFRIIAVDRSFNDK